MKTTYYLRPNYDIEKIKIELEGESQFTAIRVAIATQIEKYEKEGLDEEFPESYRELKDIDKSFHSVEFVHMKGGV